jgi:recombination protein RecA
MAKATDKKEEIKNEKEAKFKETCAALEKKYGVGTVIFGKNIVEDLEVVKTGSLGLDLALGIGGLPIGKLVEIYGPESSGKSTIAIHLEVGFQKVDDGVVVLVDYEYSFDKKYAMALGLNVDTLVVLQPDCMEDGYNQIEALIRTGYVRLVVIDSHTAGLPKAVIEGEVGDVTIALQARFNSQGLGKIKPLLRPNRCTMVGISQLRTDIGGYGNPDKPTGGNAWKFYSDIRMKVSKVIEKEKESNKTTVDVVKNKCAAPFGKAVFAINWGTGIDRWGEIIDGAAQFKIVNAKGAFYYYGDPEVKLGQGKEQVKQFLADNPELAAEIETKLLTAIEDANK